MYYHTGGLRPYNRSYKQPGDARGKTGAIRGNAKELAKRMGIRACLLCLLFLFWAKHDLLAQYDFRSWTTDNGLPQNLVRGLYQTPDGYLWIATLDGLARFDGNHFTVFNTVNTPGLVSNRLGIVGLPNGDLWINTEGGDLMRYHQGRFEVYAEKYGISREKVRGLVGDGTGKTWILHENAIMEWRESEVKFVNITPKDLHVNFEALRWDRAGFWGRAKNTLYCFRKGQFTSYELSRELFPGELWRVAADPAGNIWIETEDKKQYRIKDGRTTLMAERDRSSTTVFQDLQGNSWPMHVDARLDRVLEYSTGGIKRTIALNVMYLDRKGTLWIGTEGQGLHQLHKPLIKVYSTPQGVADKNIFSIYQDRSGAVWAGAWNTGLSRFQDGRFKNFTVADGLPSELVTALFEDRDGRLWIGSHGGLTVYENGKFRLAKIPALPKHSLVQAICQDRSGTLWFGTWEGLVSYKDGATKTYTKKDGLATDDIHVVLEGHSGDLWIGGYGGLTQLRNGEFSHWTRADGLPAENIRSLYEDSDGVLWIGTYDGGLGRFQNGKFTGYTTQNGLFNNGAFQILEDSRERFWISSNRGIYRVNKKELNEFAAGIRSAVSSAPYGKVDGMLNEECNGGLWPAGIRTREGELWFPTQEGIAVIQPDSLTIDPQPFPVILETFLLDNAPVSLEHPIEVAPNQDNFEIHYTAPSFIRPSQVRFRYKLEELDRNWVEAGPRRTAYYSHVPPGRYHFRVAAAISDGDWNEQGQALAITVLAPYYDTWWFRLTLALAVAATVALAWQYRVTQLKKAQAAQQAFSQQLIASQENERKRIAAELHDSIGQRLVVIKNLALFVLQPQKAENPSGTVETMKEISEEASLAIDETRQISYNLRPFQLDRLGLKKAIEAMVRSVSTASGIRFTVEIDDIDAVFAEDLRINFYRIVQESLGNILKHAQATEVQVHIKKMEGALWLTVTDNGRGFVPAEAPPQPGKGGFGLTGMGERARLLGGTFEIQSMPERGTTMIVEIPLKEAARG
ncbi:MAG: hypothetical protein JST79_16035 [Acidobacteria bacterium]|nr:hypothetical protein [Acidobacteriota bacterium]